MQLSRPCVRGQTALRQSSRSVALKPVRSVSLRAAAEEVEIAANNGAAPSSVPSNMLDFEELSDIVRMVNDTDIVELELKSKRFSLSLKKKAALQEQVVQVVQAAPMAMAAPAPAAAAPAAAPAAAAPAPAPAAPKPAAAPVVEGVEVTSPMSGTMYRAAAPGEPPFCKEGDRVKKGQTVCIIEAMKLMNEIEAEVAGTVVKACVENGQSVTPGQPLFIIKP
uniref:Biotin carboxyl carrier protein of acetyl-CoA carboxylase n=1 Tax=Tetradesmus obliquus TaxID=3088 RepID=A0A383W852_TETOB|eukprot:jgi/Sobl393_1/7397/SZX73423.1